MLCEYAKRKEVPIQTEARKEFFNKATMRVSLNERKDLQHDLVGWESLHSPQNARLDQP